MIRRQRLAGNYWYRLDCRDSVTNIVDEDDDVVKSYTYDAYDNTESTGTFVNSFAYTGTVIDTKTGLYYMNARYYDPDTGRFISEDTYRGEGEVFWNLYMYCSGDPVNCTDATGHKASRLCTISNKKNFNICNYKNVKLYKNYYFTITGKAKLIPGAGGVCYEQMDIYFQIVPADCHGHKVKTMRVYEIDAAARTTLKDNNYYGGNGAYLDTFLITNISINYKNQKIKTTGSTSYINQHGNFCKYYPGCYRYYSLSAKAKVNKKLPFGGTTSISFGWRATIDSTEYVSFVNCCGAGGLVAKIRPWFDRF